MRGVPHPVPLQHSLVYPGNSLLGGKNYHVIWVGLEEDGCSNGMLYLLWKIPLQVRESRLTADQAVFLNECCDANWCSLCYTSCCQKEMWKTLRFLIGGFINHLKHKKMKTSP